MLEIAQWVAPIATMIAAMMTAANIGTRVTGWGFVIFSIGAVAWVIVGITSGQRNLLISNGFLLVVNLVGIWRWLGRQARYDEGAKAAFDASRANAVRPTLFAISKVAGRPVLDTKGATIGHAVDAMAGCGDSAIGYIVVSQGGVGGVGEELHALGWQEAQIGENAITAQIDGDALGRRPVLDPKCWPESAEAAGVAA
jgi:hypothetical protein